MNSNSYPFSLFPVWAWILFYNFFLCFCFTSVTHCVLPIAPWSLKLDAKLIYHSHAFLKTWFCWLVNRRKAKEKTLTNENSFVLPLLLRIILAWSLWSLSLFFLLLTQQNIIKKCQIQICDNVLLLLLASWSILPKYKSADE